MSFQESNLLLQFFVLYNNTSCIATCNKCKAAKSKHKFRPIFNVAKLLFNITKKEEIHRLCNNN